MSYHDHDWEDDPPRWWFPVVTATPWILAGLTLTTIALFFTR